MPRLSRFQIMQHMKPHILNFFKSNGPKVYSQSEIEQIFRNNKIKWALPYITTAEDFIKFLLDKGILNRVSIKLPRGNIIKYTYGEVSKYEIALSINKNSYLSHYTALMLHDLTENVPKNIYTNSEQRDKSSIKRSELEQTNIDKAFSRPMRQTNQIAIMEDNKVFLLNGKNVERIGVIDGPFGPITNIERTLIDITVRPNYAGGIYEVLNAYIAAKGKFSVNKLVSYLKKMDYTYPYHQAIGFYLEKAGYNENVIKLIEKIEIKYNFYLTYEMKEKEFSERWKLFFPKGF